MDHGETAPHPSTSTAPSVGNVLGFSLSLSKGEVLLRLGTRALGPGLRLADYEAAVIGAQLPLSGPLAAHRFAQHRCRAHGLRLRVEQRAIEGWLRQRLLKQTIAGLRITGLTLDLAARLERSGASTPCLVLRGRADGSPTWVAVGLRLEPLGSDLALRTDAPWILGPQPVDADALSAGLTTRLCSGDAGPVHPSPLSVSPLLGLRGPFIAAGWKIPDTSHLSVEQITVEESWLEIRFGRQTATAPRARARRSGPVPAALAAVRAAQRDDDPARMLAGLDRLTDALAHHDHGRIAALRWLASAALRVDPARAVAAVQAWLNLAPRDSEAIRTLIAAVGQGVGGHTLARRLAGACRFPNPPAVQVRMELSLSHLLLDHLGDRVAAQAMIDPLAARVEGTAIDRRLAAEIQTCVAKAHADEPTRCHAALDRALALTKRNAERASVQQSVARALLQCGHTEAARALLSTAARLAPDDAGLARELAALGATEDHDQDHEHGGDPEPAVPEPERPAATAAADPPMLALVPEPERSRPKPSPSDEARRAALEAFERQGDIDRAIEILDEALALRPTDGLVLSVLKSITASEPTAYLQALQRALSHDTDPSTRDRWALELAMTASEHGDVARVEQALAEVSAEAADSVEVLALRQWCAHHPRPPDATELDDRDADEGLDVADVDHPAHGPTRPSDDDHLEALDVLLAEDFCEADLPAIQDHAAALVGHEDSAHALAELANVVAAEDPRRKALVDALLSRAHHSTSPRIAVTALGQAAALPDDATLRQAWPLLSGLVTAHGDDGHMTELVAICRACPGLANGIDALVQTCLLAYPESAQLHTVLRHACADALATQADDDLHTAAEIDDDRIDATVLARLQAIAAARACDAVEHSRLLIGAASCMRGPAGAAALARRAESLDWRKPAFTVLLDTLERAGHWPQVIALHEARAQSAPTAPERLDAHKRLAHIQADVLGDATAAVVHLEGALEISPTDPDLLLPLLDHHFGQRDLSRAVELTSRALDCVRMGHAAFASLAHRAADAAIAMGDPVTAAELLSRVVSRNPSDEKARARLHELELMAGDPGRRIELLGAVADRQSGKARLEALEERARLLLADERPEPAMEDLATVCREAPERSDSVRRLAALYHDHGRHEALVALHERQLQLRHGAEKIPTLLAIADLHTQHTGDLGRAEAALRIGLEHAGPSQQDPQRVELEDGLIENLKRQGRYAELAAWLESHGAPSGASPALDPADPLAEPPGATADADAPGERPTERQLQAWVELAAIHRDHLADESAAATIYRRLEAHGALPDDGLATLARWYRRERRFEDLVRILELRATALAGSEHDERRALVERWIGELLEGPLQRPQDAAHHYLEAYLAGADSEAAAGRRARSLLSGTDSIANVRAALLQRLQTLPAPRHPALFVLLADLLAPHEGYETESEQYYRRALAADPGRAPACEGLGRLLLRMGRPQDAARALIAAVRSDGLPPARAGDVAALAARCLSEQGRAEQAESILRLGLSRMPDSPRALMELAAVHERAGRSEAQAEVLGRLATLPLPPAQRAEVSFARAMLLRDAFGAEPRGPHGERARALMLEAVSADPRHAAARQTLVELASAREEWSIVAHMHYLSIRELPPGAQRAASHLDLAEVYLDRLGDPASCIRNVESALQQASDSIVVTTRTTALARRMPDPNVAAQHFEHVAGGDNELDEAARSRLWLLAAELRMDQATPSASVPPRDGAGGMREELAARGDYAEVVEQSRKLAATAAPEDPERAADLLAEAAGFAWHALREPTRAAELLAEALHWVEHHAAASAALLELVRTHESGAVATEIFAQLQRWPKRAPAVALALALLHRAAGDEAAAMATVHPLVFGKRAAMSTAPVATQLGALRLADRLLVSRGDRSARLDVISRALTLIIEHDPSECGDTATDLARLQRETGDLVSASATCELGLHYCPEHRRLLQTFAELLQDTGAWSTLIAVQQRLAKIALSDDAQAMWLTWAARVCLDHPEAAPSAGLARQLLVRACAVAPMAAEPRITLLPISFWALRLDETLELAQALRQISDARGEPEDALVLAALAQAFVTGSADLATHLGPPSQARIERWLLPGLRHILDEIAVRGPLPRLDDVLRAAARICGGRLPLTGALARWAAQQPDGAGVALGLARLHEAAGQAVLARHRYQLAAFLAPDGGIANLVARIPPAEPAPIGLGDLTGGSLVRAMLCALRGSTPGLPWAEAFTPAPPLLAEREVLEDVEQALGPMRRALQMPLALKWVQAGPRLGIAAQAGAPEPSLLVSPSVAALPPSERRFRLARAAIDAAMGLAAIAPPGPGLPSLLEALHQHCVPGTEAFHEDARTLAESLRIAGAPRGPQTQSQRAVLLDELRHHRGHPEALAAELDRRRDTLATALSGRLDGAFMACARDAGVSLSSPAGRAALLTSERVQWLLRTLALR